MSSLTALHTLLLPYTPTLLLPTLLNCSHSMHASGRLPARLDHASVCLQTMQLPLQNGRSMPRVPGEDREGYHSVLDRG